MSATAGFTPRPTRRPAFRAATGAVNSDDRMRS
jgi:hypothetical protein